VIELSREPGPPHAIAIVGVGNLLLSDDGAGIHAVRMLGRDSRAASAARLIDGGTVGTDLLAEIWGCAGLLIIDAVDAGLPPGSIIRMDYSGPGPQQIDTRNAHQLGIPSLLDDMRLLGRAPCQVVLMGVQPATLEVGTELSPEVANALPVLAGEVLRQVEEWRKAGGAWIDVPRDEEPLALRAPGAAKEISGTEQLRECI
jgi:hydrogenase maturation protease